MEGDRQEGSQGVGELKKAWERAKKCDNERLKMALVFFSSFLPSEYIEHIWADLAEEPREYICEEQKNITKEFVLKHWGELTHQQKYNLTINERISVQVRKEVDILMSFWRLTQCPQDFSKN